MRRHENNAIGPSLELENKCLFHVRCNLLQMIKVTFVLMADWTLNSTKKCKSRFEFPEKTKKVVSQMAHQLDDLVFM